MSRHSFPSLTTVVFGAIASVTWLTIPAASAAGPGGPVYGQMSSSLSQKAGVQGTLVTMDSNDALGGLEHDDKG
jgi:hypothetical protein